MRRLGIFVAAALLCGPAALSAQGRGNGRDRDKVQARAPENAEIRVITREEERIVREWFGNPENLRGLPPGLAKKEQLPPGLQRQLVRNGTLPPGLEKKIESVPSQLEIRLPRLPDGRRRIFIGNNLIVMDSATSMIVDMIANIF